MIDSVIFAFGYKQRSGKDTAVAEIIKRRGLNAPTEDCNAGSTCVCQDRYDIRRYSFASALKREVNAAAVSAGGMENLFKPNHRFAMCKGYYTDFPDWVQYDPNAPMDDPMCPLGKQRSLLQWWGGDFRRNQDSEYWVRQLAQQIELEKPQLALISDLRYLNEFHFCKEYGEVVKVERLGIPQGTHSSEVELDSVSPEDWSLVLENNGSLEEFLLGAVMAFDELLLNFPQQRNVRQALGV
jgi:hypothetical protein